MSEKTKLRRKMKRIRRGLSGQQRREWDQTIAACLFASPLWQKATHVLAYHAMNAETGTLSILKQVLKTKTLYLPRCFHDRPGFEAVAIQDLERDMVPGPLPGLMDPRLDLPACTKSEQIDLILVPGLAFDIRGNRLGYGKGMYDRFLASNEAPKVALVYDCQVIPEVPVEAHDQTCDFILTEEQLYRVS